MRMKQAQQTVSMASGTAIAAEGVAASLDLDLDSQDSIELAVTAILAGISSIAGAKEP